MAIFDQSALPVIHRVSSIIPAATSLLHYTSNYVVSLQKQPIQLDNIVVKDNLFQGNVAREFYL